MIGAIVEWFWETDAARKSRQEVSTSISSFVSGFDEGGSSPSSESTDD